MADEREAWENEVLAEYFAKAGDLGGSIGGAAGAGGAGFLGGGRGGARGARRAAVRMKNDVCELEITLRSGPEQALERVTAALSDKGHLLDPPFTTPGVTTVASRVGSALQNPAVVTAELAPAGDQETRVKLRSVAKISLLQRHTGEKVAQRIREALEG